MKLTLKIKLIPTDEQAGLLMATLREANKVCNSISKTAFDRKVFNQYKLHHEVYYPLRKVTDLSSEMIVRCEAKVADSYKLDKKVQRIFRPTGSMAYSDKILGYKAGNNVSIWCMGGRQIISFVCHNPNYIQYIKGEADLVFNKGKWYLYQTIDIPNPPIKEVEDFIGCDFGQTDICTLSDGTNYNSEQLKKVRKKYSKVRASVQSKGTKGSKKLLKRLSGKERRFVSINNHSISKQVVAKAIAENKGITIEDLSNIRKTAKPKSRALKTELNRWSFFQLRQYLTYKATLSSVPIFAIPPAYTSQTCNDCFHIGERNGKRFSCKNCGNTSDADHNAAKNIATWGQIVNCPEKSDMFSCALHY